MAKRESGSSADAGSVPQTRRQWMGAVAMAAGAACGPQVVAPRMDAATCGGTSRFYAGPFYVADAPERVAIHEGIAGAPFDVHFTLFDASSCRPLPDVVVDVWCAAPSGWYSGVDNALVVRSGPSTIGQTWQRGRQRTDAAGRVRFEAVYPGWYPVTPPHLHCTAEVDGDLAFTWQLFLDDAFSDAVYTSIAPYDERGPHVARIADRRASLPGDLIVTPVGSPAASSIDVDVIVDARDLTRRVIPFDPVTGRGGR